MIKKIIQMEIFTDGSCRKNTSVTNYGAWSYLIHRDNQIITTNSGSVLNTTNQRMELMAAAEALEKAISIRSQFEEVILYSDSAYLVNCWVQSWWQNWISNDWKNAKRQPVANQDLWWRLIPFFEKQHYIFQHVKGHADSVYNNMVDKLAQEASLTLEKEQLAKAARKGIQIPIAT